MNEEFNTQFYKLHVFNGNLNLEVNSNDYHFTDVVHLNSSLEEVSGKYDMGFANNSTIHNMISDLNGVFEYQYSIGNIVPKMKLKSDDIDKTSDESVALNRQKAFNLGIGRLIKKLEVDFNIVNEHDQKLIANKISNQYKKHNGNIFDIRACYTRGDDTPDALFSYIKKYQRESGVYEQLIYNDVTKSHILIGFGYPDYTR